MQCFMCQEIKPSNYFSSGQKKIKATLRKCIVCTVPDLKKFKGQNKTSCSSISELVHWGLKNGVELNNVAIEEVTPNYRLMKATKSIKRGSVVMKVPLEVLIRESACEERWHLKFDSSQRRSLDGHTWLALGLLNEFDKGGDSFWAPYLATLPQDYQTFALMFSNEDAKTLGERSLVRMMRDHRLKKIEKDFCELLRPHIPWTFRRYLWARISVVTRIFKVDIDKHSDRVFVPFADMLNHSPNPNTSWCYSDKDRGFVMVATRYIPKGSELTDSYGEKCNSRYFVNYGFSLPQNLANNQAVIFLPAAPPHITEKIKHVEGPMQKMISEGYNFDDGYSGYVTAVQNRWENDVSELKRFRFQLGTLQNKETSSRFSDLLFLARVLVVEEKEMNNVFAVELLISSKQVMSVKNEKKATELVLNQIRDRLQEIPFEACSESATLAVQSEREVLKDLLQVWTQYHQLTTSGYTKKQLDKLSRKFWKF